MAILSIFVTVFFLVCILAILIVVGSYFSYKVKNRNSTRAIKEFKSKKYTYTPEVLHKTRAELKRTLVRTKEVVRKKFVVINSGPTIKPQKKFTVLNKTIYDDYAHKHESLNKIK